MLASSPSPFPSTPGKDDQLMERGSFVTIEDGGSGDRELEDIALADVACLDSSGVMQHQAQAVLEECSQKGKDVPSTNDGDVQNEVDLSDAERRSRSPPPAHGQERKTRKRRRQRAAKGKSRHCSPLALPTPPKRNGFLDLKAGIEVAVSSDYARPSTSSQCRPQGEKYTPLGELEKHKFYNVIGVVKHITPPAPTSRGGQDRLLFFFFACATKC